MKRFKFHQNLQVPPLSWCAKVAAGVDTIPVEHGAWVELGGDFFVEGGWASVFGDKSLHRTGLMLGSGGEIVDERVIFTPTTHTMERLYSLELAGTTFVSNSLVYLLQATGSRLNPRNWDYEFELMSFLRGFSRAVKHITLREGRAIRLHYHYPFVVDGGAVVATMSVPEPPPFDSYRSYVDYLLDTLTRLQRNARADRRRAPFETILTTISSGYDSPACAVLAKQLGCCRSVTFADARTEFAPQIQQSDDSGEHLAAHLGIGVEGFSRLDYLQRTDFPEALFLATGNGGDDVVMSVLGSRLRRSLLFTGFLGDTLWDVSGGSPVLSRDYRFLFPAGGSLQEFRLHTGFIHVPVPLLTFTRHPEIRGISLSDEMSSWRIGGAYDRPIPRRLLEESGVPRAAFGQEKRAITQPFWLQESSAGCMGTTSLQDYRAFVQRVSQGNLRKRVEFEARWRLRRRIYRLRRRVAKRIDPYFSPPCWSAALTDPLRFHWAVDKLSSSYCSSRFAGSHG